VHKYAGRVLLIANPSCAIHCRYCFRRHFPYEDNTPGSNGWQEALAYIAADSSIHEVILSGGDPLSSNDTQLRLLIQRVEAIEHVQTLRIHTRLPVVIPERITDDFLNILLSTRLKPVMVLHINHANELSYDVCHAIQLLQQAGVRLFNQAVLLKGVNDTLLSQQQLLQALHTLDVQAYYLHQLDNVKGAQHFAVSDIDALHLLDALKATLPGYMLPKLVREIPAHSNKTALHF
jgi:EF-P beta-lysylation protein EpmB